MTMCSSTLELPSLDVESQLSLPEVLDFHLIHNPTHPIFVYPETATQEVAEISMLEYVRACYRAGNAVLAHSQPGDVVAIVCNLDSFVYSALILGMMKAGLVPFPISPRNSPTAIVNLLRRTKARRLLATQSTLQSVLSGLRAELSSVNDPRDMTAPSMELYMTANEIQEAPSLQELFPHLGKESAGDPFTPLPLHVPPNDADMAMYLHSSGSTGFPKPIGLSHKSLKDYASLVYIPDLRRVQSFKRMGAPGIPSFHLTGFTYHVLLPLYGPFSTCVFAPTVTKPEALPTMYTPDAVLECAKLTSCDGLTVLPPLLHAWSQSDKAVEFLSTLLFVTYGGGPLAQPIGEGLVHRGVRLTTVYGGTEFGIITKLRFDQPETSNWMYFEFSDRANLRWIPQGGNTFEAQILSTRSHQPAVEDLEDVKGYATKDILEPHPTVPGLWKLVGRLDDVLIHSSGEKTVPAPLEELINASSLIGAAVMFGRQRDQPGLLVEIENGNEIDTTDDSQVASFRNKIWPVVEEANKIAPAFSRIYKEMILFASSQKPLPRTPKGGVPRKAAIALYSDEIDRLYDIITLNIGGDSVDPPQSWDAKNLQPWLVAEITSILSGRAIDPRSDLFEQGFDSLSATILRMRIIGAMRASKCPPMTSMMNEIPQNLVYNNPTVFALAEYLVRLISGPSALVDTDMDALQTSRSSHSHMQAMEEMIERYSQGFDSYATNTPSLNGTLTINGTGGVEGLLTTKTPQYVLLTGSTGNLGAHILGLLLEREDVERVYTLNRPSSKVSMLQRHRERFEDKQLDVSLLESPKLVFVEGEAVQEDFGLSRSCLDELRGNLTMVIHTAWRLDFNMTLASFEGNISGTRTLIDLARSSRRTAALASAPSVRFLFTSSIASAQSWDTRARGPYPERVVMDPKYAVGGGYGESKYVTERILAKSGLQAASFRVGQISGGEPNGAWSTSNWVPIFVKSSLSTRIGVLPDAYGVVSWVPMDAVAEAILDVGFDSDTESHPGLVAINIVHPKPVRWTCIMQKLREVLIREYGLLRTALELVPYKDWLAKVERAAGADAETLLEEDVRDVPAIKLIDVCKAQAAADELMRQDSDRDGLKTTAELESGGLPTLSTENAEKLSERMRNLEPLDGRIVEKWVRYWKGAGF